MISVNVFLKLVSISRRIFYASVIFMLSPVLLFISTNSWLEFIAGRLFLIGAILMLISWVTPGIFVFLGMPSLTLAWLKGMTPLGYSVRPWDKLSSSEKISIYFYSMVTFIAAIAIVILTILNTSK